MKYVLGAYVAVTVVTSLAAFAAYGWDKRRARLEGRRIPEKTLHLLALSGGWPGALAGQQTFRHKTQTVGFPIVFWLIVLLHVAILGGILYFWLR